MKSIRRAAGAIGLTTMTVIACGGGRSESEAPSMPATPVCGVRFFESPQCENAVNFMCCSQKVECSRDPTCQRLADCSLACKHASAHDTCVTTCVTREAPSPDVQRGLALWHGVIDCASKANVPDCGDAS